ncbi:MAG: hypothetical protein IJJ25_04205 [Lachnospiraceae bacterium]|nr:hypothetical protein [Lachnospiraceae bacterium]
MFFRRNKEPEVVTFTVANSMEEAEAVMELLAENGIRSVVRDRASEEDLMIVSSGSAARGIGIVIRAEDAERAAQVLMENMPSEEESEELTDEELEELAMSMEEITGLEDEEPDESDRKVREWMNR